MVRKTEDEVYRLTQKQWKVLLNLLKTSPTVYTKQLIDHVENKTLTIKDMDKLVNILGMYIEKEKRIKNQQDVIEYQQIREKLLNVLNTLRGK